MDLRNQNQQSKSQIPGNIILWFGVLAATVLLIPLLLISRSLRQDAARLRAEVVPLETAVSLPLDPNSNAALNEQLIGLNEQVAQVGTLQPLLDTQDIVWPSAMQAIRAFDSRHVDLLSVSQSGKQLTIRGRAVDETAVLNYADNLETSGQFNQIVVQSIVAVETPFIPNTPTPIVPTATPQPTDQPTATPTRTPIPPTATADLRDEFEWDDHQAKAGFVGTAQTHNFLPSFDVDNVFFLAKAGRFYQIETTNLAPGVDTFLTVTIGEETLTNDDAEAGTLASLVQLQAPPDEDINVFIRITNRGSYGSDKIYQVLIQEIVPTATPESTAVPATATPESTAVVTVTAIPDEGDDFEPDEDIPPLIGVDESQVRTFYPDGDEDHLDLLIDEGQHYRVATSLLADGIDTIISVDVDSIIFENDNYQPTGTDDFSSAVCFSAPRDTVALIDIRNNGVQFDPDGTYTVSAEEVSFFSDVQTIDFGDLAEGAGTVSAPVQLDSDSPTDWTVETETPWLQLDLLQGVTPATFNVTAVTDDLLPGFHEGVVTIDWTGLCQQQIPVSLTIVETTGQLEMPISSVALAGLDQAALAERPFKLQFKRVRLQGNGAVEFIIVVEFDSE